MRRIPCFASPAMSEFLSTVEKSYPNCQSLRAFGNKGGNADLVLQPYRDESIECFAGNIGGRRSSRASEKEQESHDKFVKS